MENRTLVKDLHGHVGKEITLAGFVDIRRDHGKLTFVDLRDFTGKVQMVFLPNHAEAHAGAKEVRPEWSIRVRGIVNKRPEKMINKDIPSGDVEIEVTELKVLSQAEELPFEKDTEVNIDTLFNYRPLTLRSERERSIFTIQALLLEAYRESLRKLGFTEFQAPVLVGGDAEGGAAAFKVEYFDKHTAYLATSPQFYKQIMVGPFERAFTVAQIFRAERSATTRHLSEATCIDFEMGFIQDETEPMAILEHVIKEAVQKVVSTHGHILKQFNTEAPLIPEKFPVFTLKEAQDIVAKEYNREIEDTNDMSPEDERQICEYAKNNLGSDFVFITRFPTKKRAFYTYEDLSEAPLSRGFDLLFRGLEINSGAQRVHDHATLVARIKERGLDPEKFSFYLQAFKYGLPPHGGCSTGLERLTARFLELGNAKEASAFPRDMARIDNPLSAN